MVTRSNPTEHLRRAVDEYGKTNLARKCGCTGGQIIDYWLTAGVPPERVLKVEKATRGLVTRYQLRPDIFGIDAITPAPLPG